MESLEHPVQVVSVAPEIVRPVRKAVLRPGQSLEQLVYEGDSGSQALHAAVLDEHGEAISIGSVMPDPHPRDPRANDWRVRGMATREELRGRGLGRAVLGLLERHAREQGATRLWCNARIKARRFYEQAGFEVESELFEIEEIGPHYVMGKRLQ